MKICDLSLLENIEDNPMLLKDYFFKYHMLHSEFNIANLCAYNSNVLYKWSIYKDRLVLYANNYDFIYPPIGEPLPIEDYIKISDAFLKQGKTGRFLLTRKDFIEKNPGILDYFDYTPRRDLVDYIHTTDSLIKLSGKKLQKKKNLVNQFLKLYPNHTVRPINITDRDQCIELSKQWYNNKDQLASEDTQVRERDALVKSFQCMQDLELRGVAVYVNDKFSGFSIFSQQNNDTYTVHYEKFLTDIKGLAQFINFETAKMINELGGTYINREQDLGIPGLRQAKLSYDPCLLIEVGLLTRKN